MNINVYLCLLIIAVFGGTAPSLSRRLPPMVGTWLLSAGAVAAAVVTSVTLGMLSLPLLAQIPLLARLGGWSRTTLAANDPVWTPVEIAALAVLAVLVTNAARMAVRCIRAATEARRLSESLPADRELAVINDKAAYAFALPGSPGHVVVTSALLRALGAGERRALLTHERAHLTQHHHVHISIARICAALSPPLTPAVDAMALACERWSDETAATVSGRETVVSALTRAAQASSPAHLPAAALAAAASHVNQRLHALRAPRPRLQLWPIAVLCLLLLAVAACAGDALTDLHELFEIAQAR